jgi:uncharacterized protein YegJ (DUF2314 family)
MKTHSSRLFVLLSLLGSLSGAFAQTISERADRDEVSFMRDEEPAMQRAFAKARASLDDFLARAAKPGPQDSAFALKVAIWEGANTEYFWVNNIAQHGEAFAGELNNEPRMVKRHKLGERIRFQWAQIVDWTYLDRTQRRMFGNFTACALLSKEPAAEAEAFKTQHGLICE